MSITNESLLARMFFDIADKIQDLMDSEPAQKVTTFEEDDYASLIANVLDAAYWIMAGQLGSELEDSPMGHELYVASSVYNDLIYRGFDPRFSWEESGMDTVFDGDKLASSEPVYVRYQSRGGVRVGRVVGDRVFSFDGYFDTISEGAERVSCSDAYTYAHVNADSILSHQRSRIESYRARRSN